MANAVGIIIAAVMALFILRMLFRDSRQAVADTKDLIRNPVPVKIAAAVWSFAWVAATIITFFAVEPATGVNIMLGLIVAWFAGLFVIRWWFDRASGPTLSAASTDELGDDRES